MLERERERRAEIRDSVRQQQVAARRDRDRHLRERGPLLVRRRHLGELAKVPAAQLPQGQGVGRRALPQGLGPAVTTGGRRPSSLSPSSTQPRTRVMSDADPGVTHSLLKFKCLQLQCSEGRRSDSAKKLLAARPTGLRFVCFITLSVFSLCNL